MSPMFKTIVTFIATPWTKLSITINTWYQGILFKKCIVKPQEDATVHPDLWVSIQTPLWKNIY